MTPNLDGLVPMLITLGVIIGLSVCGFMSLVSSNDIRSTEPIAPQIELVVEDNVVDTIYIYKEP
ncbi:MAG: hypothetical protein GY827_04565 [Cytophagales bacterium]|nr:hypothetical protein [Cytophagales bacterium]